MKACPGCGRLVHCDTLANLAATAKAADQRGDVSAALQAWREALDLLPVGSRQHEVISAKITELGRALPVRAVATASERSTERPRSLLSRITAPIAAAGLLIWKLKAILSGLTKGATLFSMLLSLGVYWAVWGWKFALGLVLSIYLHEMGHVVALRRYGFKATAPTFIPGLGALIRLQQHVVNPYEDAEIGLAGPIYGLAGAVIALALWALTHHPIFAAIAGVGAWINLFNLLPIGMLDGSRGFHALSQPQKLLATAVVAAAWFCTQDGLLILLGLVCFSRAAGDKSSTDGSVKTTTTYVLLVIALSAIAVVRTHAKLR
jgi:Zn-dependent protease